MSSSHNYPLIPRLLFLLAGAFILGGQAGKLHSWQKTQATSASLLSESTSWGLSFQKEGERPVGNATINALGKYHAYYAEDTNERKIYLTFDAGYENGNTPRILDALKKHQAPATFFVVGNFISDNPDLIQRMVSEGHTVGNHTMTHPDMSGISSKDDFLKQLNGVEELYESVTGEKMSKFYRPPQGIYSTSNLAMAQELGYSTFFWSLAYVDWIQNQQPSREEAFQKLLGRIHPGAIVLLHNTSSTNGLILDDLLTKWEEMGYRFCSLKELTGA
ncbi:polysaccharide deacetylase family protein [Blautia obeum]|jgi:peptidoglycan-N-acetylmuramic acid deacetylase|uniref:polysaccharide deacetylase family protein n=1 Tax=Blautia obeum TaxID=40520 RepID=UPI00033B7AEF|nr:polysaccharide deacetylase family protein [Blautia obeum]RHB51552.1 delta-lactam-biosynthetic de-N-acetylase [Blautia obeum]CDD87219.1 putative delta-lactam-biosynthetic de-N-acetylase [Blautia obeum CAG:39]